MSALGSIRPWLDLEVARITIELSSPFLVGAADNDGLHDSLFVTDANGLPTIPGDSLAGVLRHALAGAGDPSTDERCREVFGFQDRDQGSASALSVSWAQVHGGRDEPVPFRGANLDDEVLTFLASGLPRDHVRIGPDGAVDKRGKFDELLVPAGARFTFELSVDRSRSSLSIRELIALLARPEVRLGGSSRRGLGKFTVVRARCARFDLRQRESFERYAALPVPLEAGDGGVLEALELGDSDPSAQWVRGEAHLDAADTWLVGGTIPSGREPKKNGNKRGNQERWDRFPFTERKITWTGEPTASQRGHVEKLDSASFVVPGSSIKGALRHRAAFHARRLRCEWLPGAAPSEGADGLEHTAEELELFGEVKSDNSGSGRPGRVLVDDVRIAPDAIPYATLQHVCLDRFTQGPRDGLLFDELTLYGGSFIVDIEVRIDGLSAAARRALALSIEDLCHQRLALGAGRSHGRFSGKVCWSDKGQWLEEQEQES